MLVIFGIFATKKAKYVQFIVEKINETPYNKDSHTITYCKSVFFVRERGGYDDTKIHSNDFCYPRSRFPVTCDEYYELRVTV